MVSAMIVPSIALAAMMLTNALNAASSQDGLPAGWRLPTAEELSDDWRSGDPGRRAEVKADFDGDGNPDRAIVLIGTRRQCVGLFVLLSGDKSGHWHKVDVIKDKHAIRAMGLAIVPPGFYATACGKGYFVCKPGEASSIQSDLEMIDYFKIESANRYIYFDRASRSLKKAWMSD